MDNAAKKNYQDPQTIKPAQEALAPAEQVLTNKVPFSAFERFMLIISGIAMMTLMICLVSTKITLSTSQRQLQTINNQISNFKSQNTDLAQEIGTLNSSDRLQNFAQQHGLSFNESAIRNISK